MKQISRDQVNSQLELGDPNRTEDPLPGLPTIGKECRICLNGTQQRSNRLVSPCQCQGSMKYVHQYCLREWLQVKALRDSEGVSSSEVQCQLCKTPILVQLQVSRECNSCETIKKRIQDQWMLFTICFLGSIFSIGLLVYSAMQLRMQIKNGYQSSPIAQRVVVISSIGLNIFLLVFFSYNLSKYFLHRKAEIKLVDK